ncbi:hypothetical protein [Brevibacillus sp. AF8]|uniref:hypothetical protein n=1 Tax=Brevibacillus sp. AF8 TaxID=2825881 RepID=UPI001E4E69AD|nr:hypothetical protein [Brevibacillus sp. AF8]MCE0450209.1 hypothetical protein [Brevibacillus sp. AF8]
MKMWKQGMMTTALLMGLTMPGVALAQDVTETVAQVIKPTHSHDEHGEKHMKVRHSSNRGVHQKMYMLLLAEKYAPDSVGKWQAAFKERDRLMSEFETLSDDPKWQAKREERKQLINKLNEKVKKGEITNEQMEKQFKEWKDKNMGPKEERDARKARIEQMKKTHEAFDSAIESGDTAKIKESLQQMLEQMQANNSRMAEKLAMKKK